MAMNRRPGPLGLSAATVGVVQSVEHRASTPELGVRASSPTFCARTTGVPGWQCGLMSCMTGFNSRHVHCTPMILSYPLATVQR
jgi:hypothetical protein